LADATEIDLAIKAMVRDINPGAPDLDDDTDISAVLDSLDFVDLIFNLQERFSVPLPDEAIEEHGLTRLDALVRYVAAGA
jgi:acyl carrier protein